MRELGSPNGSQTVYVYSNAQMPGQLKIGRTASRDYLNRIYGQLNAGTGGKIHVELIYRTNNAAELESALHYVFDKYRVDATNEWFSVIVDEVIEELEGTERGPTAIPLPVSVQIPAPMLPMPSASLQAQPQHVELSELLGTVRVRLTSGSGYVRLELVSAVLDLAKITGAFALLGRVRQRSLIAGVKR